MFKSLMHILTLITFVLGTFQFASMGQYCKMMGEIQTSISCACSENFESGVSISQGEMKCCSIKKFEKDKVQDFADLKVEILKFVSFIGDVNFELTFTQKSPELKVLISYNFPPPESNLYIKNSTLLI